MYKYLYKCTNINSMYKYKYNNTNININMTMDMNIDICVCVPVFKKKKLLSCYMSRVTDGRDHVLISAHT